MAKYVHTLKVGDPVEAHNEDRPAMGWSRATVYQVDEYDNTLPYRVKWDRPEGHGSEITWVRHHHIRKVEPQEAAPKRLQYRVRRGTTWSEWVDLTLGNTMSFDARVNAIQVREAPARTADEIITKIRGEIDHATLTTARLRDYLNGDF